MTKIVWKYFVFALYTSNDDTGFWKKHSFRSKNLVLPKNYQGAKLKGFWSQILSLIKSAK